MALRQRVCQAWQETLTKSMREITHHLCPYGRIHWRAEA